LRVGAEVVPVIASAADASAAPGSSGSSTFVPFQNVPGPKRLQLAEADNSGSVNASPEWMADRLAILNFITARPRIRNNRTRFGDDHQRRHRRFQSDYRYPVHSTGKDFEGRQAPHDGKHTRRSADSHHGGGKNLLIYFSRAKCG
jgi:hypothetical protein